MKWRAVRKPSVPAVNEPIVFSATGRYVSFNGSVWDTGDMPDWTSAVASDDHPIFTYANTNCVNYRFGPEGRTLRCYEDTSYATIVVSLAAVLDPVTFSDRAHSVVAELSDDGSALVVSHLGPVKDLGPVEIWDPIKVVRRSTLPVERSPGFVQYRLSPDGRLLAALEGNGDTDIWDVATASRKTTLRTRFRPLDEVAVAFSPDGGTLAVLTKTSFRDASLLELWDIASGTRRASVAGQPTAGQYGPAGITIWENQIFFSRDGRTIISASDQGIVDASTGKRVVPPDSGVDRPVALSASGLLADYHDDNGRLTLRDSRSLRQTGQASIGGAPAAFFPDGHLMAVADAADQIQLWDVTAGRPLGLPFAGFFQPEDAGSLKLSSIRSLVFTPDGSAVLAVDGHGRLRTHLIAPDKIKDTLCAQFGALSPTDWKIRIPEVSYRNSC